MRRNDTLTIYTELGNKKGRYVYHLTSESYPPDEFDYDKVDGLMKSLGNEIAEKCSVPVPIPILLPDSCIWDMNRDVLAIGNNQFVMDIPKEWCSDM